MVSNIGKIAIIAAGGIIVPILISTILSQKSPQQSTQQSSPEYSAKITEIVVT